MSTRHVRLSHGPSSRISCRIAPAVPTSPTSQRLPRSVPIPSGRRTQRRFCVGTRHESRHRSWSVRECTSVVHPLSPCDCHRVCQLSLPSHSCFDITVCFALPADMSEPPPQRITRDPRGDVSHNFEAPTYDDVLKSFMSSMKGCLAGRRDRAIQQLLTAWTTEHESEVAAWEEQDARDAVTTNTALGCRPKLRRGPRRKLGREPRRKLGRGPNRRLRSCGGPG